MYITILVMFNLFADMLGGKRKCDDESVSVPCKIPKPSTSTEGESTSELIIIINNGNSDRFEERGKDV